MWNEHPAHIRTNSDSDRAWRPEDAHYDGETDGHGQSPQGQDPRETEYRLFSVLASVPRQDPL